MRSFYLEVANNLENKIRCIENVIVDNTDVDVVEETVEIPAVVKEELGVKRNREIDLKEGVVKEQANIKKLEAEKQKLLSLNKNEQQRNNQKT